MYPHRRIVTPNQINPEKADLEDLIPEFNITSNILAIDFSINFDQTTVDYLKNFINKDNSLNKLTDKISHRLFDPPLLRYDRAFLRVKAEGKFAYGGVVSKTTSQRLKLEVQCLKKEDTFIELELQQKDRDPVVMMLKYPCSTGLTSAKGALPPPIPSSPPNSLPISKENPSQTSPGHSPPHDHPRKSSNFS